MGFLEIILFPVYVFIFYLFVTYKRKRTQDPLLKKYLVQGFWVKIISTIAITIFNWYISPGDSVTLYYPEGVGIYRMILKDADNLKWLYLPGTDFDLSLAADSWNAGYFSNQGNYMVIKLVAVLSFFSFGRYSILQLLFSMIAFTGMWKLFKFFYEQNPHLHKQIAISILFFPTVVFWSSGILKDPLCMSMLGWMTYAIYKGYHKKNKIILNSFIAIIAGYILYVIKSYILFSYLPFFIMYLILINLSFIKNSFTRVMTIGLISIFVLGGLIIVAKRFEVEMGKFAVEKLAESVKTQQKNFINMADKAESSFSLEFEYDGSLGSLAKMAPFAINATLFRPYLWESKKISTLLSSLESLALMVLTLYVLISTGPLQMGKIIFKYPLVTYCFFYSILFALFVGATTLNFGTLVRYKIPAMPFYLIALFSILYYAKAKKNKPTGKSGPVVVAEVKDLSKQ
ncbi:MAG: hypothetical protein ABIW38_05675 [Ferruginibacter sp.]